MPHPPSIVIACSGLGHVRRGNETWARDVATALFQAGARVTLLGGGPPPNVPGPYHRLPTLRRDLPILRRCLSWSHRYLLEQLTFLLPLRRHLHRHRPDIVHLCDPDLALQLHRRTPAAPFRIVFKDGMLLGPHWCSRLPFIQVVAPYYRDVLAREAGYPTNRWFVIPHLIDTNTFRPADDPAEARAQVPCTIPPGSPHAPVILGVGDFSPGGNKRLDHLVSEVAALPQDLDARLVLAGQADPTELQHFAAQADRSLGRRLTLLPNLPRPALLRLYQGADLFAHAPTREPFGIVFLEAMACGLPVVGHDWDVTRWILGNAGVTVDMTRHGTLADQIVRWVSDPAARRASGVLARRRAETHFSPTAVVPLYLDLYSQVASQPAAS
ncbi:MAG: glycosyltransferase family 4 protein [Verrucomicrobiae bacterium]|nr:glycosyltransferase family 4 protein [Verrucomicrobiae bacterium]